MKIANFQKKLCKIAGFGVKLVFANVLAIIVTTFVIYFYETSNNILPWVPDSFPFHHQEPNSHICRGTEGFIYGKLDSNGLNNLYCVQNNLQVSSPQTNDKRQTTVPSSLLIGSSHMQAYQVPMDSNCCFLINKNYESDEQFLLYNIGFWSTYLFEIVGFYEDALDYFHPDQVVVIETLSLPNSEQIKAMPPRGGAIMTSPNKLVKYVMQYALSLRYMILHVKEGLNDRRKSGAEESSEAEGWNEENVVYLREFLKKISEPSKARGVRPILFFHPHFTLRKDGSASLDPDPKDVELYRSICEEQGIIFLYFGDRFLREYEEKNVLPYGFWNTLPNTGHLNKDGHRMIADELCKVIERLEEERKENVQ